MLDQAANRGSFANLGLIANQEALQRKFYERMEWVFELVIRSKLELHYLDRPFKEVVMELKNEQILTLVRTKDNRLHIVHLPTGITLLIFEREGYRWDPSTDSSNIYMDYQVHHDPLYYNPITQTHQDR